MAELLGRNGQVNCSLYGVQCVHKLLLLPRIVHTSKLNTDVFRTDWIPDLPTPRITLGKRVDVDTGAMTRPKIRV